MIRPFTCICLLLAAGSGLYLYQTKHQTQMVDREIERTLKLADATWQRSGVLRAEYTLLNDPSRLADLSGQYLPTLQTTAPGQFSTLNDLDHRLPAVGPPPSDPTPVDTATPAPQSEAAAPEPARVEPARIEPPRPEPPRVEPPKPAMAALPARPPATVATAEPTQPRPIVIAPPRVTPTPVTPAPAPTVARAVLPPPVSIAPAVTNVSVLRPEPTPAPGRFDPQATPAEAVTRVARSAPANPPAPFVGSALGMARTMTQPITPVTQAYPAQQPGSLR